MTRHLLLLRHGKSDWDADYGVDHDRPLAPRGRKAAATVGRFLAAVQRAPDLALSSTAVRARTTVELASEAGAWSCPIRLSRELYSGGTSRVLAQVASTEPGTETLLIAGHQPTWAELIELLAGARVNFPTGAVACIRFETRAWEVHGRQGTLVWLVTPKLLQRAQGLQSAT